MHSIVTSLKSCENYFSITSKIIDINVDFSKLLQKCLIRGESCGLVESEQGWGSERWTMLNGSGIHDSLIYFGYFTIQVSEKHKSFILQVALFLEFHCPVVWNTFEYFHVFDYWRISTVTDINYRDFVIISKCDL